MRRFAALTALVALFAGSVSPAFGEAGPGTDKAPSTAAAPGNVEVLAKDNTMWVIVALLVAIILAGVLAARASKAKDPNAPPA